MCTHKLSRQSLLEPHSKSCPFKPLRRLRIRSFPELTCPLLSQSRCLPFDPKILSVCHSGTPICQNSVLFPDHTNISLTPPHISAQAVRTPDILSWRKLKVRDTRSSVREKGMGSLVGRKLVMCYKMSNIIFKRT